MTDRKQTKKPCLSRRELLVAGGVTMSTVMLSIPGVAWGQRVPARVARYPRKKVARLRDVREGVPIAFKYPADAPYHCASFLVKLGAPAGGGVGPDDDIVAFNALCTHAGGPLMGQYRHEHKAIGPCPFHLTTFDLTRHGMVIAGHATQSLPQIVLEIERSSVYATGVLGLIYGTPDSFQTLSDGGRRA